ncbi:serine-rich coiled-coil domain-containing protein 2 isoform X1 [Phyllopteryx taeniolatus]|uniref:serine-rich coiled-coil domain-containing protein 2 isoform X1 n=1 Tax=Phyllopteryx taeniolatus TaxID=161469 RepID=UPI002AD22C17|nr:serine-rich coiled-coil domain-containing protein 2 isoform X1 [Phyllopteryx taeniolatus]XP_061645582.1 serine-rich coiled-coil domain-containing protein 2 isoform X1 [Phyllopteryx taeniolatus]XP_061645583.1 serine-rich coiled-coil domain-containing protein 2 isoform X1 [Phyllopteryx taeniolatus]XP_061645584.1 serine-rich coiled-coil domain-containing protein 2 isoform X1 [Phyllopteryx taeniolatus]XP_061645585.1 serine-rich coiled-coil domain-containing protein 2 isoform X1 [Phyllopteryx tae
MEGKALTMVSRLPKFGGRSASGGAGPLSNGSSTQDPKTAPAGTRPNGAIRTSPFSLKWRRDEGTVPSSLTTPTSPGEGGKDKSRQLPSLAKEGKSASPGTPIMRRSGALVVAASSPKATPKQSLKLAPKDSIKLGQSSLNGAPKTDHSDKESSRLVRPKLSSGSLRSSSQDRLSQSNESLKSLELDKMVRSNSFTHFKQIPSPNSQPMIRSFSFNRAVELAKPLANTQLRPPRSSFLKPPQLSNGRLSLGFGTLRVGNGGSGSSGGGTGGVQYSRTPQAASSLPTASAPTTPSALKKPLLSTCGFNKLLGNSGSLGIRQPKPAQDKEQKTILPGWVKGVVKPSAVPPCGAAEPIEKVEEADCHNNFVQSPTDGGENEESGVLRQSSYEAVGDGQEDMSLSSASSQERGNTSEEFLDDLDSVGDVFSDGDPHDNKKINSFLNETSDWDLAGHNDESPMQDSRGALVKSPEEGDVCQASSLELSPSNSSGGTYMWDEEGLEPLGGPRTYPCDLYDDLNSIDILNTLHGPGAEEVNDDDLMLDVDLPDDGLHDLDRMSNGESAPRRQGQRRGHHRWNRPDHFPNDGRAPFFHHYDGLKSSRMSLQAVPSETRRHGNAPVPDELSLDHMSQDCSSVKNQLLRLKNLLQLEDTDSPADVEGEIESNTNTASQFEELLQEMHILREELRSRDKTIVQLTLKCQQNQREQMLAQERQVRCQCQQQRAPSLLRQPGDKRLQRLCDKATQTHWRPSSHSLQIPFNLNERFHPGRPVKALPTEGRSDQTRGARASVDADAPLDGLASNVSAPADPSELSHPRTIQCSSSGVQCERQGPAAMSHDSVAPASAYREGASRPATKPLRQLSSLKPLASRSRQLPPPSRGLPCFNNGPRQQIPSVCRTSPLQPHRISEPHAVPHGGVNSENSDRGSLKEPAKMIAASGRSCLPKPKIP